MCDARTPDIERELALADAALEGGEPERALACATTAVQMAEDAADRHGGAGARLRMARAHACLSRLRDAYREGVRAAGLFGDVGDAPGELLAWVECAHAASFVRYNESALSAALRATTLAGSLAQPDLQAAAFDALGLARLANGDFDRCDEALEQAAKLAAKAGCHATELRSRIRRCYGEIVRATVQRHLYNHPPDPQRLDRALDECRPLFQSSGGTTLAGAEPTHEALMSFAEAFAASWRHRHADAASHADRMATLVAKHARTNWLRALAMWAQAEVAFGSRSLTIAESSARCMIDVAASVEHEQIVRTGLMLASRIYDAQGRSGEAIAALRTLVQRDIEIRTSLDPYRGPR